MKKKGKKAHLHFEFLFNKRLLNSKRSQSHVEIILSFVIFIGFLLFVFIFMNPFAKAKDTSYIMDNIQKTVIGNITEKIGKLSIILNKTGDCYDFNETNYKSNYYEVQEDNMKYMIYFSNIFTINAPNKNSSCNPNNYTLGVYSEEEMVVYEKIINLKNNYNSDYNSLKSSLGITNDFSFNVENMMGEELISVSRNIPTGIDVEAREIPIRTINSNGQIQELILNIKAW